MKRFWLFAGSQFTPEGGMKDLIRAGDNLDDLFELLSDNGSSVIVKDGRHEHYMCWAYVLDTQQMTIHWPDWKLPSYTMNTAEVFELEDKLKAMLL